MDEQETNMNERNIQADDYLLADEKAKEMATNSEKDINNKIERRYGWRSFRPDCLQFLNRPVFFLVSLCLIVFGQGLACTGINNTMITSIEKRYGFKTTQIGIFSTLFHTSVGTFVSIVCYFGHRHRPFTLGMGCLAIGLGLFIITIPHYLIPKYEAGVSLLSDTCRLDFNNTTINTCKKSEDSDSTRYFGIFAIGYICMGLGVTPLYSLGYAHCEDIVGRGKSSLYLSIMSGVAAFGPAVGFSIANPILKVFVDWQQPENSHLTPENRNWVGAWWVGYLVGTGIVVLASIPMLGFPSVFDDTESVRQEKNKFADTNTEDQNLNNDLKSLWPATKSLLKNLPFVLICLASAMESFLVGGFAIYLPKFIETQFHLSAAKSALMTGIVIIPGAAVGMFTGAYFLKKYKWDCKRILRNIFIVSLLSSVCILSVLIGCKERTVIGGDVPYANQSTISLQSGCNEFCQCSTRYYKPVCSVVDQQTYYSACHAGCSINSSLIIDAVKSYYNCSCASVGAIVIDGSCKPECNLLPVSLLCMFIFMAITLFNHVPMLNAIFRIVPKGQSSFATGFVQLFGRFLGFIPAPTMFGRLIDESCKLWHKDECTDETTSCLEYKNKHFRYYIFALGLTIKIIGLVFMFAAYKIYKLPKQLANQVYMEKNGNIELNVTELPIEKQFDESS